MSGEQGCKVVFYRYEDGSRGRDANIKLIIIPTEMLFNSIEFLLFLPIVFFLFWFVAKPFGYQNLFIVVASYVFYGWWDWRFLILIAITTFCSYLSGLFIEYFESKRRWQRVVCVTNIFLNLGILAYYKYYNFFGENFASLMNSLG